MISHSQLKAILHCHTLHCTMARGVTTCISVLFMVLQFFFTACKKMCNCISTVRDYCMAINVIQYFIMMKR